MGHSVVTFDTRCRDRFYNLAAEARHHATPDEADLIHRLVAAQRAGEITARDAHAALAHIRRQQQQAA